MWSGAPVTRNKVALKTRCRATGYVLCHPRARPVVVLGGGAGRAAPCGRMLRLVARLFLLVTLFVLHDVALCPAKYKPYIDQHPRPGDRTPTREGPDGTTRGPRTDATPDRAGGDGDD